MRKVIVGLFLVVSLALPAIADVMSVASTDYASNANNLTSGTVAVDRLPVGTTNTTVAAGNDVRFNSVPYGQPTDTVDNTRVLMWVD